MAEPTGSTRRAKAVLVSRAEVRDLAEGPQPSQRDTRCSSTSSPARPSATDRALLRERSWSVTCCGGRPARLRGPAVPAQLPAGAQRPAGPALPGRQPGRGVRRPAQLPAGRAGAGAGGLLAAVIRRLRPPGQPLGVEFDHPGTATRLAALRDVAEQAGATVNQVVLAWLIGGEVPAIPLVGASSVAQLNESLAAVDLELTADQRTQLTRRDDIGALQPRRRGLVPPWGQHRAAVTNVGCLASPGTPSAHRRWRTSQPRAWAKIRGGFAVVNGSFAG